MLDEDTNPADLESVESAEVPAKKTAKRAPRKTAKKAAAAEPAQQSLLDAGDEAAEVTPPAKKAAAKKTAAKKTAKKAPAKKAAAKKTTAKKAVATEDPGLDEVPTPENPESATAEPAPAVEETAAPAKKAAKRAPRKKAAKPAEVVPAEEAADTTAESLAESATEATSETPAEETPAPVKKAATRRTRAKKAAAPAPEVSEAAAEPVTDAAVAAAEEAEEPASGAVPLFQAPETPKRRTRSRKKPVAEAAAEDAAAPVEAADEDVAEPGPETVVPAPDATTEEAAVAAEGVAESSDEGVTSDDTNEGDNADGEGDGPGSGRRRRRRGGRRRRKGSGNGDQGDNDGDDSGDQGEGDAADQAASDGAGTKGNDNTDDNGDDESSEGTTRRRRRRRRAGESSGDSSDDPANTVTRVRQSRTGDDQITAVSGSARLEAKKQRRREGREAGRRRAPIVSEAEFLARRESVDRVMVVRQKGELTQIGVLEDKVLVEHYVSRESQNSLIGNVYLRRVQNVLPSMEAAFVDIGKGRNAVLYAGEVNWSALGHKEGQPRKIESVLSSGQSVLVQVTKDPIGHKGARLTSQVSLAGRFLVYVPDGTTSGISRKLPDTERARLKSLLKEIVPDSAGVIVRTAAEGATEEELTQDVERLKARWEDIEAKSKQGNGPKLLYGEPDLTLKVVRDLFTEDFSKLVVEGDDAWDTVHDYVDHVAPDLLERVERFEPGDGGDSFAVHRIDEQIAKGLDRKVWLPSGGSLIIDRTEAMTVVDVNTGKFTGSGGNLEETVTKNNLEAAEEIVRQLRLRDIGGIIVVDFIDMVLESNRDLVLRRLVECLGRDRTRHQVAEVTSLGLVQMTRKRIGTGLLEAFSENCDHCQGRGVVVHDMPIEPRRGDDEPRRGRKGKGGQKQDDQPKQGKGEQPKQGRRSDNGRQGQDTPKPSAVPSPADVAAVARPDNEPIIAAEVDETPNEAPVTREPAEAPAGAPVVSTRSRRGRRSAQAQPSDATPTEAPGAAPSPAEPASAATPATAPVVEPAASQSATSADVPAAPTVSTVSRTRRSARTGVITPKAAEPIVVATETVAVPEAVASTPPPKVVTRSRRRGGASTEATVAGGGGSEAEPADLHVPVKKRGSRKR